mmetsp:Transcript_31083/g.47420  ORF Transcript_31083/g.47420 Transcript_31083/m.47420 type:complete len:101 (+) Transcript_31083:901-1203(+)
MENSFFIDDGRSPLCEKVLECITCATGSFTGDPHIRTFHDLEYDCQADGEVVLVKTLNDDDSDSSFQIQARFSPRKLSNCDNCICHSRKRHPNSSIKYGG